MTQRTVVVVGGTGLAGRAVVEEALRRGDRVRAVSRHVPPAARQVVGAEYVAADALAPDAPDLLRAAFDGADTVVDTVNGQTPAAAKVLTAGAASIALAARDAGVGLTVVLSILNVDRGTAVGYYRTKLAQERVHQAGAVPSTVVRAAQFHDFFDTFFGSPTLTGALTRVGTVPYLRGGRFQPIDVTDVARAVVDAAQGPDATVDGDVRDEGEPGRRTISVAGPEEIAAADLARLWADAHGSRRIPVGVPLPGWGPFFASGAAVAPDARYGRVTYADWLARTAEASPA
ncbi:SDR family oxidoreductase [Cellulomonas biazotea]|uniref:Epimerase n=1 Tax=Cellulomonas biazotea TaxID=1709 RepID=A0A402DWK3_9CELL|nr:NmrA family NAD(P)-binding protein [Cellulomonas biazotea]GCE78497.1 epimerase [Cellulomonas biazotea]